MEVNCQLHNPAALPLDKHVRYPLKRRLGVPRNVSGRFGVEKPTIAAYGDSNSEQFKAVRLFCLLLRKQL
jgi:hypothetical protein